MWTIHSCGNPRCVATDQRHMPTFGAFSSETTCGRCGRSYAIGEDYHLLVFVEVNPDRAWWVCTDCAVELLPSPYQPVQVGNLRLEPPSPLVCADLTTSSPLRPQWAT